MRSPDFDGASSDRLTVVGRGCDRHGFFGVEVQVQHSRPTIHRPSPLRPMTEMTQDQVLFHSVLSVTTSSVGYWEQIEEVDFAGSRSHSDIPRILRTVVHTQDGLVQFQRKERLRIYVRRCPLSHFQRVVAGPRRAPSCRLRL